MIEVEGGSVKLCENCNKKKARIRFCSNKCKDRFHNKQNPRGYFRHLSSHSRDSEHIIAMDSREDGWDGHKDTF